MEDMIQKMRFFETAQKLQQQLEQGEYGKGKGLNRIPLQVDSEITIYQNAIKNSINKRGSSSSEDCGHE